MTTPSRPPRSLLRRAGGSFIAPALFLLTLMWAVELVDAALPAQLDQYGIRPRSTDGLLGVLLSPLLHVGFGHLASNSLPFLVLGSIIALEGRRVFWLVSGLATAIGGLGTWLISPANVVVVGASGVVFAYLTYVLLRVLRTRQLSHAVVGLVVLVVYGSLLWGVLPSIPGVSWQAHLCGAVAGLMIVALRPKRRVAGV